ncbi:MAG TPA: oligosaccharide flippase family protein [Bryobacteraceae bacterium]|nr:oligosaccharide flippase family protein [Bryobacteraceae bacterium]
MASPLKTLAGHSAQYFSGRAAGIALGMISFPVFTRVFSVAEYGTMSLVLQIAGLGAVASKLGIQNSVQRFYEEYLRDSGEAGSRRFHSTFLTGIIAIAAAVTLLFVVGLAAMPVSLVSDGLKKLLLLTSSLIFLRGVQSILLGFYRAARRTTAFNFIEVSGKGATIGLTIFLVLFWNRSVEACLIGTVAVEALAALICIGVLIRDGKLSIREFDSVLFRASLAFGVPLAATEFANVLLHSGDRIIIAYFAGAEGVGYYSAAYTIASYMTESLMYPASFALMPIYMHIWVTQGKEKTQAFLSEAMNGFAILAFLILAGTAAVSHDAITFLGSAKLAAAAPLLPPLMLGLMLFTFHIFLNAGLLLCKKTFELARTVGISAVVNLSLNVILLPLLGLKGAALAILISYIVMIVLLSRASAKVLPLRVDVRRWIHCFVAAAAGVAAAQPFRFESSFLSLLVRGSVCVLTYVVVLFALNRALRLSVFRWANESIAAYRSRSANPDCSAEAPQDEPAAQAQ